MQVAKEGRGKCFAVLIDPDKATRQEVTKLAMQASEGLVDYFFVGGSLLMKDRLDMCLSAVRQHCRVPTVLFPGSALQLSDLADGILLLSLISGRNADLLIGQHVVAAPFLRQSQLEIIPTAYMLIDGGVPTSASYMSNTVPIPRNKKDIAQCTAMAGEMLGLKLIYMDAGSGAKHHIPAETIAAVREVTKAPIIIGGGIRSPEQAAVLAAAGADVIVVGTAIEQHPNLMRDMADAIHSLNTTGINTHAQNIKY